MAIGSAWQRAMDVVFADLICRKTDRPVICVAELSRDLSIQTSVVAEWAAQLGGVHRSLPGGEL